MLPITQDDVMRRVLQVFPHAELGEDNDGQLVVYTGLYLDGGFTVTTDPTYGPIPDSEESDEH